MAEGHSLGCMGVAYGSEDDLVLQAWAQRTIPAAGRVDPDSPWWTPGRLRLRRRLAEAIGRRLEAVGLGPPPAPPPTEAVDFFDLSTTPVRQLCHRRPRKAT